MGELVLWWEPRLSIEWYIPWPRYRKDGYRRYEDWFESCKQYYPHMVYIDRDKFGREKSSGRILQKEIRRWVAQNVCDEVIVYDLNLSFMYLSDYYLQKPSWEQRFDDWRTVQHGYWVFFFDNSAEAVNFSLRFADSVETFCEIPDDYRDTPAGQINLNNRSVTNRPNPDHPLIPIDE